MRENPIVSVIMSVYNTNKSWLKESIQSILNQTFSDFEFIIVLDCPTDESEHIVLEFTEKDDRIIVLKNKENIGLTKSLNKALKAAKGKYVARMDADDISVNTRFEKQVSYLQAHKDVAAVGSRCFLSVSMKPILNDWTEDQEVLAIRMMFGNSGLPHPSAMIRKRILDLYNIQYWESMKKSQDYKLWVDLMPHGRLEVLPDILLIYREHGNQVSANVSSLQEYAQRVSLLQAEKLVGKLSEKEKQLHTSVTGIDLPNSDVRGLERYFKRIIRANKNSHLYKQDKLKRELNYLWCRKAIRRLTIMKRPDMCFSFRLINMLKPSFVHYVKENKQRTNEYQNAIRLFEQAGRVVKND